MERKDRFTLWCTAVRQTKVADKGRATQDVSRHSETAKHGGMTHEDTRSQTHDAEAQQRAST